MMKIKLSYLSVEETGVNTAPRHPKDLLKSDKTHSNSPVYYFFFYITKLGGKIGRRKIARDKGIRMEVGGGLEMNGSGGFIGCCQGG